MSRRDSKEKQQGRNFFFQMLIFRRVTSVNVFPIIFISVKSSLISETSSLFCSYHTKHQLSLSNFLNLLLEICQCYRCYFSFLYDLLLLDSLMWFAHLLIIIPVPELGGRTAVHSVWYISMWYFISFSSYQSLQFSWAIVNLLRNFIN